LPHKGPLTGMICFAKAASARRGFWGAADGFAVRCTPSLKFVKTVPTDHRRGLPLTLSRLAYRTRQFWNALLSPRKRVETEVLLPHLSPSQIVLFRRMQPSEQAHAYQVFERLKAAGQTEPDLLAAALLHDVGKILVPLSLPDRVVIVLGKRLFRRRARRWGEGTLSRLRRPFVVASHHPGWGADLAKQAGASSRTVDLIRHHQDISSADNPLLAALQAADDEN